MHKAVVLGGYGLIGAACMRALSDAGFAVTGIGRSRRAALRTNPDADWIIRDLPAISADEWRGLLTGVDVVVNAAGALQDGGRDDLEAIHVGTIARLVAGASGLPVRIVQISAAGVAEDAETAFFRTKAQGDGIIRAQVSDWVILRPVLVLAPEAYGGTALLRAAAALPGIAPAILPDAMIQTVHVADVSAAVVSAARGEVASGTTADLTEAGAHRFPDLLATIRRWQGYPPAPLGVPVPTPVLAATGRVADLLGHLGWRSPLRTTALKALTRGIRGDPSAWQVAGGQACRSLGDTLRAMPATRQERLFARVYLALPLAIGILSLFWCLSGLIALADLPRARALLTDRGLPAGMTEVTVIGGAIADLILGIGILMRRWTRPAALGMMALSVAYLAGSAIAAPDLWADPLGPMVKVLPGIGLAAMVWLLVEAE